MNSQWQRYKALELIPESAPAPQTPRFDLTQPIALAWRSLLDALAREQFYEQRTEYLERCWMLNYEEPYAGEARSLQKLWKLMD